MNSANSVQAFRSVTQAGNASGSFPITMKLLGCWRVTDDADAAIVETKMLADLRAHYGRLPFANMGG